MSEREVIADDEVVVRGIDRSDPNRFQPPDRVSSGNFKERKGERGISVFRLSKTTPDAIFRRVAKDVSTYLLLNATVGAIRQLTNVQGQTAGTGCDAR